MGDNPSAGNSYQGPSLEELDARGYHFDFGKYFETGWKAMKDDIGQFILYTLVMFMILGVSFITLIGPIFIAFPLFAGSLLYGRKALLKEERTFNDFFGGFKFFGPLLGYMGLILLFALLLALPIGLVMGINLAAFETLDNPDALAPGMLGAMLSYQFLLFVVQIVITTFLFFTVPLIVIGHLGTIDAIKWSIRLVRKNFWWILLFAFVTGIVQQAGVLVCYIGLLFTIPLAQCLTLGVYAEIVGLDKKNGEETLLP